MLILHERTVDVNEFMPLVGRYLVCEPLPEAETTIVLDSHETAL
jgi:hypothetical protein